MTIRDMISEMRTEMLESPPADALTTSDSIVKLTALMGNIHDEIGRWERLYHHIYHELIDLNQKMAADKIDILAKDTDEYANLQSAKRLSELCDSMIQGLKYRARALQGEYKESGNL